MTLETGISVVIPTFRRESVLIDTIMYLLALEVPANEILVLDQTIDHLVTTEQALTELAKLGRIAWVRLPTPSIPVAMNQGLRRASQDIVLFLDDDIDPDSNLVGAHLREHAAHPGMIVAGRVLQPWHGGTWDSEDALRFGFNSPGSRMVVEFMGGNFSVDRRAALAIGGFDENFVRVAYRFEADFALRWSRSGRQIKYVPEALIHHLKASEGGTRTFGDYLRSGSAAHSVGEYYFLMKSRPRNWLQTMLRRPVRAVVTRHHLRRPWWIPVTLIAEASGFCWALLLGLKGRKLLVGCADLDAECQ